MMLNEGKVGVTVEKYPLGSGTAIPGPQRERGLWSFLTWSFFLSQLAVGNAFISGAAHANGGIDLNAPDSGSHPGAGSSNLASLDARALGMDEPQSNQTASAGSIGQSATASTEARAGGIDHGDFTGDAVGFDINAAGYQSVAGSADAQQVAGDSIGDGGCACPTETPPGLTPGIDLPGELPPIIGLTPILDGILPPVVETVDDLASVLGPTLDLTLAPIETLVGGLVGGLQPTLDPLLSPVASLAEGASELLGPIGGIAGDLADPLIDIVEPVLSPVMNIASAAQPILDPVLGVASPIVELVEPVANPLLQPLASVAEPVLEILPTNLGNSGFLGGIFGGSSETDAIVSDGALTFTADTGGGGHDLFHAGSYTEYGIALHETSSEPENGVNDLLDDVAAPIGDLLGDNDDGNSDNLPTILGSLQHEIGLRGFGEGLI